jgi:hypothetical protein
MTSRKKSKHKAVKIFLTLWALLMIGIALTAPEDLPQSVAQHEIVKTVYGWKEQFFSAAENKTPDIRSTGKNEPAPETGYAGQDRKQLEKLIEKGM